MTSEEKVTDAGEAKAGGIPSPPRISAPGRVEKQADSEAEREVHITFVHPDGSTSNAEFKGGQTVEVLKSHVETALGIPMSDQTLRCDGRVLIDPMSLIDYDALRAGAAEVVIEDRSASGK